MRNRYLDEAAIHMLQCVHDFRRGLRVCARRDDGRIDAREQRVIRSMERTTRRLARKLERYLGKNWVEMDGGLLEDPEPKEGSSETTESTKEE
ncbi:MAG: hypothetical protein IK125_07120 [Lachnospiraceae bacterium]|nr:hypothetical protein [Lachnospiraceae bacterium]